MPASAIKTLKCSECGYSTTLPRAPFSYTNEETRKARDVIIFILDHEATFGHRGWWIQD